MDKSTDWLSDSSLRKWALAGGLAAGAGVLVGRMLGRARQKTLPLPHLTPPALDGNIEELELIEGTSRYYERPGTGTPVVLLHSLNAAASSYEFKPLFDHYATTTERPIFALDWIGFGLSDRPNITYRPELFQRQLRRFLSERCGEAPDVIALSLAGEYAASVAVSSPFLVNRLALVAPTGLSRASQSGIWRRVSVDAAAHTGAFEAFFYRMTQPNALRHFYEENIFQRPEDVPDALVEYAYLTAQVRGGHHAPRFFINGSIFLDEQATSAYRRLSVETCMLVPSTPPSDLQEFDLLEEVAGSNPEHLTVERVPGGFMPHWDARETCLEVLDQFFSR